MEKEVWQPSFGDNLKKLSKSRVSVEKLEKKKKNIVSITSKTLSFYVFWLAESEFVMEKEIWSPNFGDNLKKLLSQFAQELNWLTLAYTLVIERPMQTISTPFFVIRLYMSF